MSVSIKTQDTYFSEFTFIEGEHLDLTTYGIESAVLTFGDYDNDGDKDAIVGDEMGRLHTFENTAGEGAGEVFEVTSLSITDNLGETIDIVNLQLSTHRHR